MRVSCPQCGAEFPVDASQSAPDGLRVTCSVCGEPITVDPAAAGGPDAGVSLTPPAPSGSSTPYVSHSLVHTHDTSDQLMEMISTAERERREMAWQMTRELLRLREMVEQQQMMVGKLMTELANKSEPPAASPPDEADADDTTTSARFEHELDELRDALEKERDVVERLRQSKLELERRATSAEETLDALRRRGFFDRLLGREDD